MQKLWILKKIIILCLLLLTSKIWASIDMELKNIPYRDKFFLKEFFKEIFLHDSAGHVLFFDTKPACLTSFSCEPRGQYFLEKIAFNGWKIWKKYDSQFPHPNFIFVEDHVMIDNQKIMHVFLINKKNLKNCLEVHATAFHQILENDFSPQNFLDRIETEKKLLPLIHYDECLLGLILGFGYESALAFKEQNTDLMDPKICPPWTEEYRGIHVKEPKRCRIYPVGFMGNPHSQEVETLSKRYEWELNELWLKYKLSRNTLKLVLEQLCCSRL